MVNEVKAPVSYSTVCRRCINYSFSKGGLMKRLLGILAATILMVEILAAQPMSGSYTVGGPSPNYATLQAVANAVKARGVSGPVWFNIRPGIYMENGGLNSVMILDSIIAGISSTNRITYQPDQNSGGNVGNTKLQIDLTTYASTPLVSIQTDHVTIRNLTLEDVDSTGVGADFLISIAASVVNLTTEDIVIEGCRFIGNPHPTGGPGYGTEYGVYGSTQVSNIVIRQNTFQRLLLYASNESSAYKALAANEFVGASPKG